MSHALEVVPVTLRGCHVVLEPLSPAHEAGLALAGSDPGIWTFMSRGPIDSAAEARSYVAQALAERDAGRQLPFAICDGATGHVLGSTRFGDIQASHRGLEIGWTFLAPRAQRTAANTEAKLLLLGHAFQDLGALRVCLKTDARNLRSQRAIERLGAVREGVLRQHMVMPDGYVRDTVMYSIVAEEWPAVRARLQEMLERRT